MSVLRRSPAGGVERCVRFETGRQSARQLHLFHKPVTALNAHGGEIVGPEGYRYLNYEQGRSGWRPPLGASGLPLLLGKDGYQKLGTDLCLGYVSKTRSKKSR